MELYVTAYYETDDDETPTDVADKLRGWGFTEVDIEVEG